MQSNYTLYCLVLKVVQEYERAVIFRVGRLLSGGSKGPGNIGFLLISIYSSLFLRNQRIFIIIEEKKPNSYVLQLIRNDRKCSNWQTFYNHLEVNRRGRCVLIFTHLFMKLFLISGIFFVLPCIEGYTKVDLRTVSFDVPPQEVGIKKYAR